MTTYHRRNLALLGVVAILLASTLLFLYLKSNSDKTSTTPSPGI
jgi:hypothetical protein